MELFQPGDRNPNGTWNGARVLARMAGTTEEEVRRQWKRIDHLRKTTAHATREIVRVVLKEPKNTPWNAPFTLI